MTRVFAELTPRGRCAACAPSHSMHSARTTSRLRAARSRRPRSTRCSGRRGRRRRVRVAGEPGAADPRRRVRGSGGGVGHGATARHRVPDTRGDPDAGWCGCSVGVRAGCARAAFVRAVRVARRDDVAAACDGRRHPADGRAGRRGCTSTRPRRDQRAAGRARGRSCPLSPGGRPARGAAARGTARPSRTGSRAQRTFDELWRDPPHPPHLLHGDLQSGNVLMTRGGGVAHRLPGPDLGLRDRRCRVRAPRAEGAVPREGGPPGRVPWATRRGGGGRRPIGKWWRP